MVGIPVEVRLRARRRYRDIFNEVEVDVVFEGGGGEWRVPAFWAGGNEFRARFAAREAGRYR